MSLDRFKERIKGLFGTLFSPSISIVGRTSRSLACKKVPFIMSDSCCSGKMDLSRSVCGKDRPTVATRNDAPPSNSIHYEPLAGIRVTFSGRTISAPNFDRGEIQGPFA